MSKQHTNSGKPMNQNNPKTIGDILNKTFQEPAPEIEIQNPALKQFRKSQQQKSDKNIPLAKLVCWWKVPFDPAKPKFSHYGDWMIENLKQKFNYHAKRQVEALEFYLQTVLSETRRAIIYDNRPDTKYPVYKEWRNGKLLDKDCYGYKHEKQSEGKILPSSENKG